MNIEQVFQDMEGVGQPFPHRTWVGNAEGAQLDIIDGDLTCIVGCPNCTREDCEAFMTGFKNYSYQQVETAQNTLAWWVLGLPSPLNLTEAIYHAKLSEAGSVEKFLKSGSGKLTLCLLDRHILMMPRMRYGLETRALEMFRGTIERQLTESVEPISGYYRTVAALQCKKTVKMMFRQGTRFRHTDNRNVTIVVGGGR